MLSGITFLFLKRSVIQARRAMVRWRYHTEEHWISRIIGNILDDIRIILRPRPLIVVFADFTGDKSVGFDQLPMCGCRLDPL